MVIPLGMIESRENQTSLKFSFYVTAPLGQFAFSSAESHVQSLARNNLHDMDTDKSSVVCRVAESADVQASLRVCAYMFIFFSQVFPSQYSLILC